MLSIILTALALVSFCHSTSTEPLDPNKTEEVIFVPYDVKFVPIELHDPKLEKQLLNSKAEDKEDGHTESTAAFDVLDHKFDIDQTKPPEDYILIPISVFKALEDQALEGGTSKAHRISKRQTAGNSRNVYRPVVQFSSITRNRRRVFRPPPLVGYLNKYDRFPTVA